jgi:hypothetical protein
MNATIVSHAAAVVFAFRGVAQKVTILSLVNLPFTGRNLPSEIGAIKP